MRSIVLLILAAMALSTAADGCCCGGGGVDGIGGPKMMRDICPVGDAIRGPHMTYAEDGRFGVAVAIDPSGTSSMAFVRGEEACGLDGPCSVEASSAEPSSVEAEENLQFSQAVTAHLDDVLVDFNARLKMLTAK